MYEPPHPGRNDNSGSPKLCRDVAGWADDRHWPHCRSQKSHERVRFAKKKSQQRMPFAKSSVRLRRMTRFFPKTRPECCRSCGAVYNLRLALDMRGAKMLTKDELSWRVPAAEMARDGLMVRYGEVSTAKRGESAATSLLRCAGGAYRGSTERNHPSPFTPFLGPEVADFCPVAQIPSSGELRDKWTMLVLNEGEIQQRQTMARAIHAGRVVYARICVRKIENRADYSEKILEEDGNLWNQVQRYVAIYRR